MVPVDEVRGQEDGDDEGEEQRRGDDGLTHVVTYHLWRREQPSLSGLCGDSFSLYSSRVLRDF